MDINNENGRMIFKLQLNVFLMFLMVSCEKHCRYRDRPISSEAADAYEIVDVSLNQNLTLQCHLCNEKDDLQPKNWYIHKPGSNQSQELQLSMSNEIELNRIWVSTDHSLNIYNLSENETGLYYCINSGQNESEDKYKYLVDLIYEDNSTERESGNLSDWAKYSENFFAPINQIFSTSMEQEFTFLRDQLNLTLEMMTSWNNWGKCEVCGRPNQEGIKKREGTCKIRVTKNSIGRTFLYPQEIFFFNMTKISCRSINLGKIYPRISNVTRIIPDFIQHEKCEGTCNPDTDGSNSGWKLGKTKHYKYRKTFVIPEKSHLTVVCPESTLQNVVVWRKGGIIQKPGMTDNTNLFVDTFNTLYLVDVTKNEEGNYTCQVDDIRMQEIKVHIIKKSRLITHEFVRHLGYLAFILSLTLPCYFAGLIVTWWRRATFKSFEELVSEYPDSEDSDGLP